MCEDVKDRQAHQGRKAQRRTHVVAENQKCRAERSQMAQAHAVDDRTHRMFAHAEMHVAAAWRRFRQGARAIERKFGLGGGCKIGGAANDPGYPLGERVENLA